MRSLLVALSAALVTLLGAQSPSLTGVWNVTGEGGRGTTADGGTWSTNPIRGTLTLTQSANDVRGSWKGQMPEAWAVTGELADRTFELRTEWRELPVTRDGIKSTMRARWVFRGTLANDSADGTLFLDTESRDRGERSQRFVAKRTP